MKRINEAVMEALVRNTDEECRLIAQHPSAYGAQAVALANQWMRDVEPHRAPDGTIKVFVEGAEPDDAIPDTHKRGNPPPAPTHYVGDGHPLKIVAEPVTIDGEQVDVVLCPDGLHDIVRREGSEQYDAWRRSWRDNSADASRGVYLTAAAAIADRAHLAGGAK